VRNTLVPEVFLDFSLLLIRPSRSSDTPHHPSENISGYNYQFGAFDSWRLHVSEIQVHFLSRPLVARVRCSPLREKKKNEEKPPGPGYVRKVSQKKISLPCIVFNFAVLFLLPLSIRHSPVHRVGWCRGQRVKANKTL